MTGNPESIQLKICVYSQIFHILTTSRQHVALVKLHQFCVWKIRFYCWKTTFNQQNTSHGVILQGLSVCMWIAGLIGPSSCNHYNDVIMGAMASQITSLTIVYSTVCSCADQRKHQSSASLAFVWGIHRLPVNSPHKWPVMRKMFPFDDVIMYYDHKKHVTFCNGHCCSVTVTR